MTWLSPRTVVPTVPKAPMSCSAVYALVSLAAVACLVACTAATRDAEDSAGVDSAADTAGPADVPGDFTAQDTRDVSRDSTAVQDSQGPDAPPDIPTADAVDSSAEEVVADATDTTAADGSDTTDTHSPDGADVADSRVAPGPGAAWQMQLYGGFDASVEADVFVVSLFSIGSVHVGTLHDRGDYVICAFTAGQWSAEMPDASDLPGTVLGAEYTFWPGYYWVDPRAPEVYAWIDAKVEAARLLGCDGVLPRDLDGYDYDTGLTATDADWVALARKVASQAHDRGLTAALPSLNAYATALEPDFDLAWVSDCVAWSTCAEYSAFPGAGKLVLHAEFAGTEAEGLAKLDALCADPVRAAFSTIVKTWELTAWRLVCP